MRPPHCGPRPVVPYTLDMKFGLPGGFGTGDDWLSLMGRLGRAPAFTRCLDHAAIADRHRTGRARSSSAKITSPS